MPGAAPTRTAILYRLVIPRRAVARITPDDNALHAEHGVLDMEVRFWLFLRRALSQGDPMELALTLTVIVLSLRFGLGRWRLPVPYDVLKISKAGVVSARLLSVGFLAVPLTILADPFLRTFSAPLPYGVLFCIPGLIAVHTLRRGLEIRGNRAKPVMAWLDRGVLAGWTALGLDVVAWFFTTLPLLPPIDRSPG